jgi:hypothetical protein
MFNRYALLLSLLFSSTWASACDSTEIRQQLTKIESEVLLKNAPTFKQAWDAGAIKLTWSDSKAQSDHCVAQMSLSLPEVDLQEANAFLEQNPAKRILSAAQGYSVPDPATQQVEFVYHVDNGKVQQDNQRNFALRQLHSNIEYTYQLLAQTRIAVTPTQTNSVAWPDSLKKEEINQCLDNGKISQAACDCRVVELEKRISPQQKVLIDFIRQHPYSVATGAMDSYMSLSKQVDEACKQ